MWKPGQAAVWAVVALLGSGVTRSGALVSDGEYRAIVDHFASAPDEAIERMLAMPAADVEREVHAATSPRNAWPADALDRALLMHGDAAVALSAKDRAACATQLSLADDLAVAAGGVAGNEWFVHRWYKALTARVPAKVLDAHWHEQGWYRAAAAIDRGRELELDGGQAEGRADTTFYDPAPFRQAIPLFEQGVAAHLPVAAVHLGRIQMLRGNDREARRLLQIGADDRLSRVNRYLAHLFLGSMAERDAELDLAEQHYRQAAAALPRAQSGRLALAALLDRRGREGAAREAVADRDATAFYDPWWSYFHGTAREYVYIFAELHSEVSR